MQKLRSFSSVSRGDSTSDLIFSNKTRFIILVLSTLCCSIAQSNTLTFNFTVICMAENIDINLYNNSKNIQVNDNGSFYQIGNRSDLEDYNYALSNRRYIYTSSQKNLLFSIAAVGAVVAAYPAMMLIQKYGSRPIVAIFGFLSALVTALVPLAAYMGINYFIVARFFQGTGLATGFVLIGIVTRQWCMQKQTAFFLAFLTSFFQIGPIFTMPVAGILCTSSFGWQSVYYLHAVVTCIIFIIFLYFYRESPMTHQHVSEKELNRIRRGKLDSGNREPVPYREILKTNAIYAIWISAIGNFMGIQVTMQFSPIYLNKVMGFPIEQTGLFSAIPQIATFCLKMFAGVLADKATCCAPVVSVKIFNCLAIGGMSCFFFALAVIPTSMPYVGLVCLICCCSIVGFNCGAFFKSSAIVAAQHNHFVMGVSSFINCLSSLIAPVIVNLFVTNDTWNEWWYVWMVYGICLFSFNVYFCIFGKGVPAEWTKSKNVSSPSFCPPPPIFNTKLSSSIQPTVDIPPIAAFQENQQKAENLENYLNVNGENFDRL